MEHVAFLGLGAMGSRMAANLLRAGYRVSVWNRSAAAADALVAAGGHSAATPAQAVADADVVISMVRDDEASRNVWCDAQSGALKAMRPGAVAIESSTLSPDWVRRFGRLAHDAGVALLDAPVSGSRPAAEAAQLVFLVGGDAVVLERVHGVLEAMGSAIHHVGPLGAGTQAKLATNALLGIQVTALAEVIGLLGRQGCDVARTLQAIASTSVWAPLANYLAGSMLNADFRPQFPVALIEKDFGYALAAAGSDALAPTLAAARAVFVRGIEQGLGDLNMTAVARLFAAHEGALHD